MRKFLGRFREPTLGRLLISITLLSPAIAFLLMFLLADVVRDRAIHELARDDARQISRLVFQSLYSSMLKGWNKQEILADIKRLNESFPNLKISIYRGEIVAHQFGSMQGEQAVIEHDQDLKKALRLR